MKKPERKAPSEQEPVSKTEKLKKYTKNVVMLIITLLLVASAVLAIVYRDRLNLDALKRWVAYGTLSKNEERIAEEFTFSGDSHNSFAAMDDGLLLCSNSTLQFFSGTGRQELDVGVNMAQPVLDVAGSYAMVYDAGGREAYVVHDTEVVFTYKTQSGYDLISGRINDNGWFALVEQTTGYKATVTVYNSRFEKCISWNESTSFIMDAAVSPDNSTLAVIKVSQHDTTFQSQLVCYDTKNASQRSDTDLGEELVIDLAWKNGSLWLQRESGLTIVSSKGEIEGSWSDSLRYLNSYSLDGSDYALQFLSKYRSGGSGELMLVNDKGDAIVSRSISEEVLCVSASEKYIAVLTPGYLRVFRSDLSDYAATATATARKAIMRSDGSVMLIDAERVRLFVP